MSGGSGHLVLPAEDGRDSRHGSCPRRGSIANSTLSSSQGAPEKGSPFLSLHVGLQDSELPAVDRLFDLGPSGILGCKRAEVVTCLADENTRPERREGVA